MKVGEIVKANIYMDNDLRDEGMGLQFCAKAGDRLEITDIDINRHILSVKNLDDKGGIGFNVNPEEVI